MAFVLFFLFKDGSSYVVKLLEYLPFSERHKELLSKQAKDVVVSTIYGGVAVALAQGIVGVVGFISVGVSSPALWGLATAIASFIPFIGSHSMGTDMSLSTGNRTHNQGRYPCGLRGVRHRFGGQHNPPSFHQRAGQDVFSPHLFSVLGGIQAFGLIGIILGPLIMALYISSSIVKDSRMTQCVTPKTVKRLPTGMMDHDRGYEMTEPIFSYEPRKFAGFDELVEIALDLRWSWNHKADDIWRPLDPQLWDLTRNPWVILETSAPEKLERLSRDTDFRSRVEGIAEEVRQSRTADGWFQKAHRDAPSG